MDWISTREAAEKWGVSLRHVQRLLHEGRIPGAKKYGVSWLIPSESEKPDDPRRAANAPEAAAPGYSFFPMVYIHGGDLAGACARCRCDEERALLDAQLTYFRGETHRAGEMAASLWQNVREPQLKLGAGLVLALSAMAGGDAAAWKRATLAMSTLPVPKSMEMERALAVAVADAALHRKSGYPQWLARGAFTGLPPALYPAARWIYTNILYIRWKEVELIAVAEPLIAECRREQSDLFEIYLRLQIAIAYYDHDDKALAREHIAAAAALAQPLGLLQPLVDRRRLIVQPMDAALKANFPEGLPAVKRQMKPFMAAWLHVYNSVWESQMAEGLTPREHEACGLATRGMAAAEIAWRMGISTASVKKYLNAAYGKLGVEKRES